MQIILQAKRKRLTYLEEETEEIAFLRKHGCITYWQLRGMFNMYTKDGLPNFTGGGQKSSKFSSHDKLITGAGSLAIAAYTVNPMCGFASI